jgi:predicted GNAT family acetyltransferase
MHMTTVNDNAADQRFELEVEGGVVFADYKREGYILHILHVEAPMQLRGTGAAGRLMEGIMQFARAHKEKVNPICSYAAAWLRRNPDYAELVYGD